MTPDPFQDHYHKLLAMVLWKYHRAVSITPADFEAFGRESTAGEAVLVTQEHDGSLTLCVVSESEAQRMAEIAGSQNKPGERT